MKFLPASFRETQRDWFGKKGKSWHVTVAVTKSDSEDIEVNIDVKIEFLSNFRQNVSENFLAKAFGSILSVMKLECQWRGRLEI